MRHIARTSHVRHANPQEHRRLPANGSFIILQIDAVRAPDVDEASAGPLQNIGDSRALADLYQIPRRDYDFTPGRKRQMYDVFAAEKEKFDTPEEKKALEAIYPLCTNISIDFGIMEKADNVYVIPSDFGWSDLGTWNSAYENLDKDYLANAVAGDNVVIIDATKCMVHAPNDKLMVLQGLDDFIVVDSRDVLLVCKKEKEQEIKEYVAEVRRNKGDQYL